MTVRIMHLITSLVPSGAERVLYELATRLDRKRFDVSVTYILEGSGGVDRWLEDAGIRVNCLGVRSKFSPLKFFTLLRLLGRERPHILHTHLFHADQVGRIAARIAGVPAVISTEHNVERRRLPLRKAVNSLTLRLCDRVICVSGSVKAYLEKTHALSEAGLAVIPNGINLSALRGQITKPAARKKFGLDEKISVIVSAGRLERQKGYDLLLGALRLLGKKGVGTATLVAGDGPLRKSLEDSAASMKISGSVRFLGRIDNVPELLAAADVYVQPSRWEGHPIALIEAMAAGLPVAAFDVEGVRDTVTDGKDGLLAVAGSPEALADGIARLLEDRPYAEKLASEASVRTDTEFDAAAMAASYAREYERLVTPDLFK